MKCSFCLCEGEDRTYIQGAEEVIYICSECIKAAYEFVIVRKIETDEDLKNFNSSISDNNPYPQESDMEKSTFPSEPKNDLEKLLEIYDADLCELSDQVAEKLRSDGDFARILIKDEDNQVNYDIDFSILFQNLNGEERLCLVINIDTVGNDEEIEIDDEMAEELRDYASDAYREAFAEDFAENMSDQDKNKWLKSFSQLFDTDEDAGYYFESEYCSARIRQNSGSFLDE